MNLYRRILLLSISFMMVLSLAMNVDYAAKPKRGGWFGFQVPDPKFPGIIVAYPGQGYIEISGVGMFVIKGYEFGDIKVVYEVVEYMRIEVDVLTLTQEEDPNIYSYPHYGSFTWYTESGQLEGIGTFESEGGPPYGGDLSFTGSGLVVKGKYRVIKWAEAEYNGLTLKYPLLLVHGGSWYTENGD